MSCSTTADQAAAEALLRYVAGRPARDDTEREHYREFGELDADNPGFAKAGRGRHDLAHLDDTQLRMLVEREVQEEDKRAQRVAAIQASRQRQRDGVELEPPF